MLIPLIDIVFFHNYMDHHNYFENKPKYQEVIMETLNLFHLIFVDLFEGLQNDANFMEILFISPITKSLMIDSCSVLCQNYQTNNDIAKYVDGRVITYINMMYPEYERAFEPIFKVFASLEYKILCRLIEVQYYLRTIDKNKLSNYIIDSFHIGEPPTYENVKKHYKKECDANNFTIKLCQYSQNTIKFVPQLDKNNDMKNDIIQYFTKLFNSNRNIMETAIKPKCVTYILGYDEIDDTSDFLETLEI